MDHGRTSVPPSASPDGGVPVTIGNDPTDGADPARTAARVLQAAGRGAWAFVGICVAVAIVASGFAVIGEVMLPLVFAAVLAVCFRPLASRLQRNEHVSTGAASGLVVLGLLGLACGVAWAAIRGIVSQSGEVMSELQNGLVEAGVTESAAADIAQGLEDLQPTVAFGFIESLISGISTVSGLIGGVLLGVLIMFYLLKDGAALRRATLQRMRADRAAQFDAFVSEASSVLRQYWLGRTIVSAIVASVVGLASLLMGLPLIGTLMAVTFVGGYIPYIGAVIGGALAVMVAIGTNGIPAGVLMLVVVLVANLLIENLVEPLVTGRSLRIHPLVVLLVTTLGGILGGLVGLMMAVPITVIAARAHQVSAGDGRGRHRRTARRHPALDLNAPTRRWRCERTSQ
jgi:putative heme transporter